MQCWDIFSSLLFLFKILQLGIVAFQLNPVAFLQPLTVYSIKTQ